FGSGHASTSVSAALGIAHARDLAGENYNVIAVIGDGAVAGGMATEALNHCGQLGTKLIVVLNDNGMSISPSVGAFSKYLKYVTLDLRYEWAKRKARRAVTFLPLGELAWAASKGIKSGMKRALMPGAAWEKFGFTYVGPVNGHNIREMEAAFIRARDYETRPTFIHVLTQKGKGYLAAEEDAVKYHSVSPSNKADSNGPSYSQVFGETLSQIMRDNDRVVAITAAMLEGTGLAKVDQEFPGRVFDVGICEQHGVTFAAGLATQGFIPVVAIYSTFLQRAYDQIIHDICIQNLPVVFAIDRAGIVGDDGKTHQGAFDMSYLCAIPNMIVAAPKDEDELQHLLVTAVASGRPTAIRYPRGSETGAPLSPEPRRLAIGEAELLCEGQDIAILAIGSTVYPALEAATLLAEEGIDCAVVNARYAKPLDSKLILETAERTKGLVTVEENALIGGFGSSVLQLVHSSGLSSIKVESIGLPDDFVEHGDQYIFRSEFCLDSQGIAGRIRQAFPELSAQVKKR
ncbi:MAG: 1-deoxy-D-xylulose-5-phosphate synthase, partial [Dehalococcoidia bacterium]